MAFDLAPQLESNMKNLWRMYPGSPSTVTPVVVRAEIDEYCGRDKELAKSLKDWFIESTEGTAVQNDWHVKPETMRTGTDVEIQDMLAELGTTPQKSLPEPQLGKPLQDAYGAMNLGFVAVPAESSQPPEDRSSAPKSLSPVARKRLPEQASKGIKRPPPAQPQKGNVNNKRKNGEGGDEDDESAGWASDDGSDTSSFESAVSHESNNSSATIDTQLGIERGSCRQLPILDSDTFTYWVEKKIREANGPPGYWARTATNYRFEDSHGDMVCIAIGKVPIDEELYLVGLVGSIGLGYAPSERLMAGYWSQSKKSHAKNPIEVHWVRARILEITSSSHHFFRGGRSKVLAARSATSIYVLQSCAVNFELQFRACQVEPKTFWDVKLTPNSKAPKWMDPKVFKKLRKELPDIKESEEADRAPIPSQDPSVRSLWKLQGELAKVRWKAEAVRQRIQDIGTRNEKSPQSTLLSQLRADRENVKGERAKVEKKIKELQKAGVSPRVRHPSPENDIYFEAVERMSTSDDGHDDDASMEVTSNADAVGETDPTAAPGASSASLPPRSPVILQPATQDSDFRAVSPAELENNNLAASTND
ncbi:hypothetical protein FRC07_013073, partial [Ceratobasidium sp. 392]